MVPLVTPTHSNDRRQYEDRYRDITTIVRMQRFIDSAYETIVREKKTEKKQRERERGRERILVRNSRRRLFFFYRQFTREKSFVRKLYDLRGSCDEFTFERATLTECKYMNEQKRLLTSCSSRFSFFTLSSLVQSRRTRVLCRRRHEVPSVSHCQC